LAATLLRVAGWRCQCSRATDRLMAAVILLTAFALELRLATYSRPALNTVVPAIEFLNEAAPAPATAAVDVGWYPTVRYFYEYGSFAGTALYPLSFTLPYWTAANPLVARRTEYLVTALSLQEAALKFPQSEIFRGPALPDQLYRVRPAASKG